MFATSIQFVQENNDVCPLFLRIKFEEKIPKTPKKHHGPSFKTNTLYAHRPLLKDPRRPGPIKITEL